MTAGATTDRRRPLTGADLGLPAEERTAGRRDSLTAHLRATVDAGLRVLLAEQGTAGRADSPESVHQMRVAARRCRVALRMDTGAIGPAAVSLRAELAWLGTLLGGVRDLDVLCERLAGDGADLPAVDLSAFADVLSALLASRSAAADVLGKGLRRQRYRALLQGLAAEALSSADDGVTTDPWDLLVRPVRALHLQLAASAQSPSDEGWHALRIRVKRVRYAAELAKELAGPKKRVSIVSLAGRAKALQELLGTFQDTVVTEAHLRQLVVARPGELSGAAVLVVGRLVEGQVVKRDELRELLPAASGELYQATVG
jgi:CHAD domain-containing protein